MRTLPHRAQRDGRRTWQKLVRRLYALALGSVVLSFVTAILVATSVERPPHPGIVRSALWQLEHHLDDPEARATELQRLRDEANLRVALYDDDGHLLLTTLEPAPSLAEAEALSSPRARSREIQTKSTRRSAGRMPSPWPRNSRALSLSLESPSGEGYVAVFRTASEWPRFALVSLAVAVLLALFSIPFAAVLTRPLSELVRATEAFGGGATDARVNLAKAGAFSDLSQAFNEMAERVTTSMRAEKELLANVSHELRTPLARIRVALDLAAEGDNELARASLAEIEDDLGELERLIDDILTTSRLNSSSLGAPPLRVAPVGLGTLLSSSAQRFTAAHPEHVLALQLAEPLPTLHVDGMLLRRAIDNFLDNAGKYADAGTRVTLAAHLDDGSAVITITDAGVGIAPDDQARLFTPFFRAERSRDRKRGGVGLGLVLSRRIVEAHGGTVTLSSTLGVGTTVVVRLPLEPLADIAQA